VAAVALGVVGEHVSNRGLVDLSAAEIAMRRRDALEEALAAIG